MASSTVVTSTLNALLNPVLFQVIGSTPESLCDYIKKSTLKGDSAAGAQLATVSIFASVVNKSTMNTFLLKPELAAIRPVIMSSFAIQGSTNMTALTLLGHCLLATDVVSDVTFVREFRRKLGQPNIWDGNLDSGSLGAKQKEILKEKKRTINERSAKLFGSGYWKYVGVITDEYTRDEAAFWGVETSARPRAPTFVPAATTIPRRTTAARAGPAPASPPRATTVQLSDGSVVTVDPEAYRYYLSVDGNDMSTMISSVERNGVEVFNSKYGNLATIDPEGRGTSAASRIG